jgi:hypothetical protein
MVCRRSRRHAGAVQEDNFPDTGLFLEERRLQPFLARGAGGVGEAARVDAGNPSGVAMETRIDRTLPIWWPVKSTIRKDCVVARAPSPPVPGRGMRTGRIGLR